MKRSDQSLAIYGVLLMGIVALVGFIVLLAMDKEAPEVLLTAAVVGVISGVLGWARGGTYYNPGTEVVPESDLVDPLTRTGQ